jgi:hypothetical protein
MRRSLCVVTHGRHYGFSMGREERANLEYLAVAYHLQDHHDDLREKPKDWGNN